MALRGPIIARAEAEGCGAVAAAILRTAQPPSVSMPWLHGAPTEKQHRVPHTVPYMPGGVPGNAVPMYGTILCHHVTPQCTTMYGGRSVVYLETQYHCTVQYTTTY